MPGRPDQAEPGLSGRRNAAAVQDKPALQGHQLGYDKIVQAVLDVFGPGVLGNFAEQDARSSDTRDAHNSNIHNHKYRPGRAGFIQ